AARGIPRKRRRRPLDKLLIRYRASECEVAACGKVADRKCSLAIHRNFSVTQYILRRICFSRQQVNSQSGRQGYCLRGRDDLTANSRGAFGKRYGQGGYSLPGSYRNACTAGIALLS